MKAYLVSAFFCFCFLKVSGQVISDFISVTPDTQKTNFIFPSSSHDFQKVIEHGDPIGGGAMSDNFDFTCYVPINGSSTQGHLSINHEQIPGGLTAMDVSFNTITQLWSMSNATALDFGGSTINGTARNCSGGLTPWGTVITAEELSSTTDTNGDGYYDLGWLVEINPSTKTVLHKLWALGNGAKENIALHNNRKTAYFGNDLTSGYLYKFVSTTINNLTSGSLYVYAGSKTGSGTWLLLNNSNATQCNTTLSQCAALGATTFNGIEDVEIGPDGKIYFAVKNENRVYRFTDSDPLSGTTTTAMETYVGNASYTIIHQNGTTITPWGTGNDNLAFDGQGNLWVLQDGGNNYIWVVMNGHTQASPNVKLFGIAPRGSEPTGITFTPDYKQLFISFQHPNASNNIDLQTDVQGNAIGFDKDIAIILARKENLGCELANTACDDGNPNTVYDKYNAACICSGIRIEAIDTLGINNGNDDVEQNNSTGLVNATSTDIELVVDGSVDQTVGLRFNNVMIHRDAIIISAYLQFTSDEVTTASTNVKIFGEKSGNALPYDLVDPYNVSDRIKTQDSVLWTIPPWTTIGEAAMPQRSPDLKSILAEVTSHAAYQSGNSLSFVIKGNGSRVAVSHNGNALQSAKLIVHYRNQNLANVGIGTTNPLKKLQVKDGDIYVESLGSGLIIKSPDGNCWRLTVSNTGVVSAESVACP